MEFIRHIIVTILFFLRLLPYALGELWSKLPIYLKISVVILVLAGIGFWIF